MKTRSARQQPSAGNDPVICRVSGERFIGRYEYCEPGLVVHFVIDTEGSDDLTLNIEEPPDSSEVEERVLCNIQTWWGQPLRFWKKGILHPYSVRSTAELGSVVAYEYRDPQRVLEFKIRNPHGKAVLLPPLPEKEVVDNVRQWFERNFERRLTT